MKAIFFIFLTGVLFSWCEKVRTEQAAINSSPQATPVSPPPQATVSSPTPETYGTPENKGKRMKLSEQPLEIRLFFAPNYNLTEDRKTGKYADESLEWGKHIETEVKEIDLNHDGLNERMIVFYTDPFGRQINPETYDVYFFKQAGNKWIALNSEAFYEPNALRFVKAKQKGEFDEIWSVRGDSVTDEQGKEISVDIISVSRVIDGKYQEVECRELKSGNLISCPSDKN